MRRRARSAESYASWLALAAAFSPVLVDLARNAAEHPEDRVTLLAPLLLWLALRGRANEPAARHPDGAFAIALGVGMQLFGILAQSWSIARLGLPVAVLGLARWTGGPPGVAMALLFFAIPVPDSIVLLPSPALETAVAKAAGAMLAAVGAPVRIHGFALEGPGHRIILDPADGGATLAVALAALGWYAEARAGSGFARAALRSALLSLLAVPSQTLAVAAAGLLLCAGLADAGELWLEQGAWIVVGALGLAWLARGEALRSRRVGAGASRIRAGG